MTIPELEAEIAKLMLLVRAEQAENKKHGIKHLSQVTHKILNRVEALEHKLMLAKSPE